MKRTAVMVLLLLAACSNEAEQAGVPVVTGMPASDGAVAATQAVPPPAARNSVYTSFKDCKLVKSGEDDGEDWSISRCAGQGGYDLQIDYDDARDDLVLLRRGKPPAKLGLFALGSGGFNTLAETVEWRGAAGPKGFAPRTLIVRNNVSEDPENSEKQTSILMVIDLGQACVIAQVRPQSGQNEAARAISDGPPRPCLRS